MPYWKVTERAFDYAGKEILPGHILELVEIDPGNEPWRYHVCYREGDTIFVRDLNANNVGMCSVYGPNGNGGVLGYNDVKVLGHYKEHPDILDDEDVDFYFGLIE